MFLKNVVLHEIYSKKLQWADTFGTSLSNLKFSDKKIEIIHNFIQIHVHFKG
jgi:hypothetical protein